MLRADLPAAKIGTGIAHPNLQREVKKLKGMVALMGDQRAGGGGA